MVELVVKLPEGAVELLKTKGVDWLGAEHILCAVANGTPLPKGHGRLIDADSMKTIENIQSANFNAIELIRFWIDNQPTIIEADKEGSEEDAVD